jgi:hypothetical protein
VTNFAVNISVSVINELGKIDYVNSKESEMCDDTLVDKI